MSCQTAPTILCLTPQPKNAGFPKVLAAVYLLSLALAGIAAVTVLLPNAPGMVRLAGGFLAGIVVAD